MSDRSFDRVQYAALVKAGLKVDLRSAGRALSFGEQPRGGVAFAASLVVYVLMGSGVALFVTVAGDVRLAATVFLGVLAFVIASSLLIEYQAVVLSPADHRQLAFQPVSSRTFMAARLTSLLAYVAAMALAFALAPLVAFLLGRHGGVVVAVAAGLAAAFVAIAVTGVVIGLYLWVLRLVPAARLTAALSSLQLVFSFVVYGSYMAIPMLFARDDLLRGAVLDPSWWQLANPIAWFAAWVTLAGGSRLGLDAVAAALSLAGLGGLAWLVVGRLSIDYAERLGEVGESASWQATRTARPLRRGWLFADGEARAVSLLVRAQFRFDQRFRLTVLSIVPLTIVYLLNGLREGELDPFAPDGGGALVSLAVMLFPPMLRSAVGQSEAYRAAWVFHGTPASKPGLVLGLKSIVVAGFLVPYLLLLGVGYAALVGRPWAMALHMIVLGLVSHLVLLLDMMLNPEVPFSHPPSRGGRSLATFVSILAVTIVGLLLHVGLRLAYATIAGTLALVSGLAMLNAIGEVALRERLRGLDARAEFDA